MKSAELPPPCAQKLFSRKQSRSDQLPQGYPGRPHAAGPFVFRPEYLLPGIMSGCQSLRVLERFATDTTESWLRRCDRCSGVPPRLIQSVSQPGLPGLRSIGFLLPSAPKGFCRNRSRSDRLSQGHPGCADATWCPHFSKVCVAGAKTSHSMKNLRAAAIWSVLPGVITMCSQSRFGSSSSAHPRIPPSATSFCRWISLPSAPPSVTG